MKNNVEGWHAAALKCVTASELVRAQRFYHRLDATRHLVGRALVRVLLAREFGVATLAAEFAANPWGKPALLGCDFEFSISHSGSAVWVALCRDVAVGIDVEQADAATDPHALAEVFHPAERAALLALPTAEAQPAFLRCWTRKEAIIKALGEGLSRPLSSFRVRIDEHSSNWFAEMADGAVMDWTSADLPMAAGYHASVAALASGIPITCHCLDMLEHGALLAWNP